MQGFPTLKVSRLILRGNIVHDIVKVFPRGNEVAPMVYESGDRTASAIFKWVSLRVPNHIDKVANLKDIDAWANKVG